MAARVPLARARALDALRGALAPAVTSPVRRWLAFGDPQAPFQTLAEALDAHGALADTGWLRQDVGVVSIGDHFDFDSPPRDDPAVAAERGREGEAVLAWLAAHPPAQTVMLLGNHDAVRVMEFAGWNDERFRAARAEAYAAKGNPDLEGAFAKRHAVPNAGMLRRDFFTWTEAQRALVQGLLLRGRYRLSCVIRHQGADFLATHAAVTNRELRLLGLPLDASATEVSRALEKHLARAVSAAAVRWTSGDAQYALDLSPLHISGTVGEEAGGLLAHRPSNPNRPKIADRHWEWNESTPRRYAPDWLPQGFDQIAGHTGHRTLARELVPWTEGEEAKAGKAHTLYFGSSEPRLVSGLREAKDGSKRLLLLDVGLHEVSSGDQAEMLVVDGEVLQPSS
ncbi:hypothetical protein DFJ74DRAFT_84852 [Hyaloraphidium curvatum]|nr:hypothetical protein DFJ74DRAFT_84852 [Hyaloraphidium curvatum]